jgi:hypothetical protein
MSVDVQRTTRRSIPEDRTLNTQYFAIVLPRATQKGGPYSKGRLQFNLLLTFQILLRRGKNTGPFN